MKPKGVTTQMKALDKCFLMVVFTLLLSRVNVFASLCLIWTEKHGSHSCEWVILNHCIEDVDRIVKLLINPAQWCHTSAQIKSQSLATFVHEKLVTIMWSNSSELNPRWWTPRNADELKPQIFLFAPSIEWVFVPDRNCQENGLKSDYGMEIVM